MLQEFCFAQVKVYRTVASVFFQSQGILCESVECKKVSQMGVVNSDYESPTHAFNIVFGHLLYKLPLNRKSTLNS